MKTPTFRLITTVALLAGLSFLVACGCGKKTEREQYEDATSGLKYNAYKTLSRETFSRVFLTYNDKTPDSLRVPEETGRLMLGYFWMCSGKTTFGFAEGNIILEDSKDENYKTIAKLMISIGMYENGWEDLAKEESQDATAMLEKNPDGQYVKLELTAIHLLIGTYAIYSRDFGAAKFHMAGFGTLTGINWPYQMVDAMNDIENGDVKAGLVKFKAMSQDENVPVEIREVLAKAIADVEAETGDIDSRLFWPKAISKVLYKQLKNAAEPGIGKFMESVDSISGQLGV